MALKGLGPWDDGGNPEGTTRPKDIRNHSRHVGFLRISCVCGRARVHMPTHAHMLTQGEGAGFIIVTWKAKTF